MNPSKTFFIPAIVLALLSSCAVIFFGMAAVGLSRLAEEPTTDPLIPVVFGLFLLVHLAGIVVYTKSLRVQPSDLAKVYALRSYVQGVWVAIAFMVAMIVVWSVIVESIIVGIVMSLILFAGLIVANTLGHIGVSRLS